MMLLPHDWSPRPYQQNLWDALEDGCKRVVGIWHRRAGKDDLALRWASVAAFQRPANYWHMLPEAAQARKAIWDAVNPHTGKRRIDEAFPLELREGTRDQDMQIRFAGGSSWQVVGSDNYQSLVGSAPAGIVFSEWALADPMAWAYLRPILAENNGWALFITTPRGRNHAHKTYLMGASDPDWYSELLTVEDTGVLTPEQITIERAEMLRQYGPDLGEALFQQEYYCDFNAAVQGAVYADLIRAAEKAGRITAIPHKPGVPVETYWDLGRRNATAVWLKQTVGAQERFINTVKFQGKSIVEICQALNRRFPDYTWGQATLPHDGATEHVSAEKTPEQHVIQILRCKARSIERISDVTIGVKLVRDLLPSVLFDGEGCKEGLDALSAYRYEWDESKAAFGSRPVHDWSSDYADAFRQYAQSWEQPKDTGTDQPRRRKVRRAGRRSWRTA
jgi:phage terminase large subunit